MKFTPQGITRTLQNRGVPIAKLDYKRGIKRTGASVRKLGRGIVFEWHDWEEKDNYTEGEDMVAKVLADEGYLLKSPRDNGIYQIVKGGGEYEAH